MSDNSMQSKEGQESCIPTKVRTVCESSPERDKGEEEEFPYWAVRDPDGHLVHTFLCTERDEVEQDWIKTEQAMNLLYNSARVIKGQAQKCTPSWEAFEAEGYSLVRVKLVEASTESVAPRQNELLPCPFCGGEADYDNSDYSGGGQWFQCVQCGARQWAPYRYPTSRDRAAQRKYSQSRSERSFSFGGLEEKDEHPKR